MSKDDDSEDLYQIAILIDQLKHDDLQLRILASKSLCKIAKSLGPERTREELIPFLTESNDDEDEILQIIADKLGDLVSYLGGKEYAYILLDPLESLASVEESKVRDCAISSINHISEKMPDNHLEIHYVPLVSRLAKKDWFTSRTSAISLLYVGYDRLSANDKLLMKSLFLKLCEDDSPTVRKTAAQHFGKMIAQFNKNDDKKEFMSSLSVLAADDQDSVRIQSVSSYISLSQVIDPTNYIMDALPIVLKASSDSSWRVRRSVATQLHSVLSVVKDKASKESLLDLFINLLNDTESEVRAASAVTVNFIAKSITTQSILDKLIPQLNKISTDTNENVRSSLANAVNDVAVAIGKESTIEYILPIVLAFLRDENSEVRLNIISSLDKLNQVIGVELLGQSLLPAIIELTEDSNWRVRASIIEHMPMLAEQLGPSFFKEKLINVCLNLLKDPVFYVRKASAMNIQYLALKLGNSWTCAEILPYLEKLQLDKVSYSNRMTALKSYQLLLSCMDTEFVKMLIIPAVLSMMTDDAVPNIRFTAVKTLHQYLLPSSTTFSSSSSSSSVSSSSKIKKVESLSSSSTSTSATVTITAPSMESKEEILKAFSGLLDDTDRDVRFFAKRAHDEVSTLLLSTITAKH